MFLETVLLPPAPVFFICCGASDQTQGPMLASKCSVTELHPQLFAFLLFFFKASQNSLTERLLKLVGKVRGFKESKFVLTTD